MRAVILEGTTLGEEWYILKIDEGVVGFLPANDYMGLGNYAFSERLFSRFGNDYSCITIGQAGEKNYLNSGIATSDLHGRPSRLAARGGLGAVMASKKIKGILISKKGSYEYPRLKSGEFKAARKAYHKIIIDCERIQILKEYGTASTVMDTQMMGALPTRNFSSGQFEGVENISGEKIHDLIKERGGEGKTTESCMGFCIIQCSNVYADEAGREIVAPLEYETLSLALQDWECGP